MKLSLIVTQKTIVTVESESPDALDVALADEKNRAKLFELMANMDDSEDWEIDYKIKQGHPKAPVDFRLVKGEFSSVVETETQAPKTLAERVAARKKEDE